MKVIKTSNYDLDNYPEKQVSHSHLNIVEARDLAKRLNKPLSAESPNWHLVVADNYILCDGEP